MAYVMLNLFQLIPNFTKRTKDFVIKINDFLLLKFLFVFAIII